MSPKKQLLTLVVAGAMMFLGFYSLQERRWQPPEGYVEVHLQHLDGHLGVLASRWKVCTASDGTFAVCRSVGDELTLMIYGTEAESWNAERAARAQFDSYRVGGHKIVSEPTRLESEEIPTWEFAVEDQCSSALVYDDGRKEPVVDALDDGVSVIRNVILGAKIVRLHAFVPIRADHGHPTQQESAALSGRMLLDEIVVDYPL